jgi:hypothetical protein
MLRHEVVPPQQAEPVSGGEMLELPVVWDIPEADRDLSGGDDIAAVMMVVQVHG